MKDLKTTAFALGELMKRAMTASYGMHAREAAMTFEMQASIQAVIELLVAKGVIDPAELETLREAHAAKIAAERQHTWTGPWLTVPDEGTPDKPDTLVDCNVRHEHCEAACCVFYKVNLTEHEVRSGTLLWDLGAPYSLPRGPSGHCAYLDRESLACTVWENRPYVCRGYSCANDKEIWDDFEKLIPTERVRAMSRRRREPKGGK